MTSFFAQSFEFFSHKPASICAFLATTRPIFNSSIIPVTLNMTELWNALSEDRVYLLYIFLLSDTLQFAPSIMFNHTLPDSFLLHFLNTLILDRRYFCRSLKRFRTYSSAALDLVCQHVQSLERLDCWSSSIANWQPIERVTQLKELNLSYCHEVYDKDLQHLSSLSSLEKLSLDATLVTGAGFVHFSGMKSLRVLSLSGLAELRDEGIVCLPELPSLLELNIGSPGEMTDAGFTTAATKQKNLRTLNMSNSKEISPEGLKALCGLPDLTDLNVSWHARFDDDFPSVLATIEGSLRRLSLEECRLVSNEGIATIVNEMKDLVFLNLNGCQTITDSSLKAISYLKFLTDLRICDLPLLSDEGIHFLKNCPQLSTVFFGRTNSAITCAVTDMSLDAFSQMKSLTHLELYQAKTFTDNGVAKLADSKSLERLAVWGAESVTNDAMMSLSKSNSLRTIKIKRGSQITKGAARFFDGTKIHVDID